MKFLVIAIFGCLLVIANAGKWLRPVLTIDWLLELTKPISWPSTTGLDLLKQSFISESLKDLISTELPPKKFSDIGTWVADFTQRSGLLTKQIAMLQENRDDLTGEEKFALRKASQAISSASIRAIESLEQEFATAVRQIDGLISSEIIECRIGGSTFPCASLE